MAVSISKNVLKGHLDKFYNNKVVQRTTKAYLDYLCDCFETSTCPDYHDNEVFTLDGTMEDTCNGTNFAKREEQGVDVGSTLSSWPSPDQIISWGEEILGLVI